MYLGDSLLIKLDSLLTMDKYDNIRRIVGRRIREFEEIGKSNISRIFIEFSYCILTANYRADRCIEIQENIGEGFINYPLKKLISKLKEMRYRYPYKRAKYIVEARDKIDLLEEITYRDSSLHIKRDKLSKNFRGIGYKEASHFLRNIGYKNIAIIDRHVFNILVKNGYIEKDTRLNKSNYIKIEKILSDIANKLGITLAELDLYLWYMETGKILK